MKNKRYCVKGIGRQRKIEVVLLSGVTKTLKESWFCAVCGCGSPIMAVHHLPNLLMMLLTLLISLTPGTKASDGPRNKTNAEVYSVLRLRTDDLKQLTAVKDLFNSAPLFDVKLFLFTVLMIFCIFFSSFLFLQVERNFVKICVK